jgi:hypothetical protein
LAKCTTAVAVIASETGKNSANTGIKTVPRPKPENRVSPEARNAISPIKTSSMMILYISNWIGVEYNPYLRHTSLAYLSPINFEREQQ